MELYREKLRVGLRKLYYGEIIIVISAFCSLLALIPVLGLLVGLGILAATIAALVLSIWGLVKLGDVHSNYILVLILTILNGIIGIFDEVTVLDFISIVLSLVVVWLLIKTTNHFLEEIGRTDVIRTGLRALGCNVAVMAASLLCMLISLVALELAAILMLITLIASLLGPIFYVFYLKQASEAF